METVPLLSLAPRVDLERSLVAHYRSHFVHSAAAIFHKLGIDSTKEYVSNIGRPFKIADGKPLEFLL